MKAFQFLLLIAFFGTFAAATLHLPPRGDVTAPAHRDTSVAGTTVAAQHYIRNAYEDAHTANIVTVVLGDYRAFDTLGETIVVFTAGAACILILRRRRDGY